MSEFVHLHVHSHFSLLDGACGVEALPRLARELGMGAIALTDHGALHGVVPFYRAAMECGVRPILGCELYVAPKSRTDRERVGGEEIAYHLTVLAEDETGFGNLCRLSSAGFLEGFYYRPRVDRELLARHREGLIVLSGCLAAEVPSLLLAGEYERAREAAAWYLDTFGRDRYFLELMDHGLEEQRRVNEGLVAIGRELGIDLVASNDVHYPAESDADVQEVLICVQTGKRLDDPNRMRFTSRELYLKPPSAMEQLFGHIPGALKNTLSIAERCRVELDFKARRLPAFVPEEGGPCDAPGYLRAKATEGASERYGEPLPEAVKERLEHELSVIAATGFSDYFLIVWDLVRFARSRGIAVGPGRGSAASSLVAYALKITDIDPLEHGLVFERFLNPERVTMPDIDIDFCYERRAEVLRYASERYGSDRVAQIGTFGTLAARAAVRDVGRVLGLEYAEVDRIAKMIPPGPGVTLESSLAERPELREEMERSEKVRRLIEVSRKVEGTPRHLSVHAAGIVIAPDELAASVPLCRTSEQAIVTQYPGEDLEALGYLKMDLLGLRTLTVIAKTLAFVEATRGVRIDLSALPLDDPEVYESLLKGETAGVFQLETPMFRGLIREMRPRNFNDLIAILALGRPGPMARLGDFLARRRGERGAGDPHPALAGILAETHGIMLYQEQVMRIATAVAGYSPGEADLLRRAMGKKLPEIMAAERERFVNSAVGRGMERPAAERIFDDVARFAEYGFAKSHSAAYAVIAYQTAYLKHYYPAEFMAAQLTSVAGSSDRLGRYLQACRQEGIPVLAPDVNESDVDFTVRKGAIRFGLAAVKNVGRSLASEIVERRGEAPFPTLEAFCERLGGGHLNRKALESLIRAGAFDSISPGRGDALGRLDAALRRAQRARDAARGQESLFSQEDTGVTPPQSAGEELSLAERLADEVELLGAYVSAHPLDPYREAFAPYTFPDDGEAPGEADDRARPVAGVAVAVRIASTRSGERMAFVTLEDASGRRGEVILFPRVYQTGAGVGSGAVLVAEGRLERDGDEVKLLADSYRLVGGEPVEIGIESEEALHALRRRLLEHPGGRPVVLRLEGETACARLLLPPRFWVGDAFMHR